MSRFFSSKYSSLRPYVPGEQPKDRKYVKLNTNESPFPPSPEAVRAAAEAARGFELYPDPDATRLCAALARTYVVESDNIICTNGSDEVLNFAFAAFCDSETPAVFPDITYGFYRVFSEQNRVPYREYPLLPNLKIDVKDYLNNDATVFIANPNAPTGITLPLSDIEMILRANPDHVVVIDEAYIDFGGESAVALTKSYPNLLVVMTFSKSRSMAGARLGFGIADKELIRDLHTLRYSTNPYNVGSAALAAGVGALSDPGYTERNVREIVRVREKTKKTLASLGFEITDSQANFLFVRHPSIGGKELYLALRERGVLVRHFDVPRISDYNRVTVGSEEQMEIFIEKIKEIIGFSRPAAKKG